MKSPLRSPDRPPRHWRTLAKQGARWFAIFSALALIGGLLFAWSGLYSVAATSGHWVGFEIFLEFGMRSSVRTHSLGIETPANLDDPALIERGAGHFHGACTPCHGGPDRRPSPVVVITTPSPPDLTHGIPTWEPQELFWIVKHGLKYTGMPGWPATQRDDEVWSVVAFLRQLPTMDVAEYNAISSLDPPGQKLPAETLAQQGPPGSAIASCTRCHGSDGRGRDSGAFPRLDIQTEDYLFEQLRAYADGSRASGIMEPVVTELDESEMRQLATYYAAQSPPIDTARIVPYPTDLGRALVMTGLPDQQIPACVSCHGDDRSLRHPLYPSLAGQYVAFTAQQLRLFRAGIRTGTPAADIMAEIARRMTDEQIDAAAAFLAMQPPLSLKTFAP
jgi:cytochrome c553